MKTQITLVARMKIIFVLLVAMLGTVGVCQTITLQSVSNQPISGTICPQIATIYNVSDVPTGCNISWTVSNGSKNYPDGTPTSTQMSITWDDKPNTTASITVTFSGCTNGNDNKKSAAWAALILSVKDQAFSGTNSPANVDYCNTKTVNITVPHMYVQGTGSIAKFPLLNPPSTIMAV